MMLEFIPSPSQGVWHLGPVPLRAYALCIIVGALLAIWIGEKRFVAKGGRTFRNTEFFGFEGDKVKRIDVYFGATYDNGAFVKQHG